MISNIAVAAALRVNSENPESTDLASVNDLLNRFWAMGISVDRPFIYDHIGLKPDDREIHTPPVTHLVAVVEETAEGSQSPRLKTKYTRVSDHPA